MLLEFISTIRTDEFHINSILSPTMQEAVIKKIVNVYSYGFLKTVSYDTTDIQVLKFSRLSYFLDSVWICAVNNKKLPIQLTQDFYRFGIMKFKTFFKTFQDLVGSNLRPYLIDMR